MKILKILIKVEKAIGTSIFVLAVLCIIYACLLCILLIAGPMQFPIGPLGGGNSWSFLFGTGELNTIIITATCVDLIVIVILHLFRNLFRELFYWEGREPAPPARTSNKLSCNTCDVTGNHVKCSECGKEIGIFTLCPDCEEACKLKNKEEQKDDE